MRLKMPSVRGGFTSEHYSRCYCVVYYNTWEWVGWGASEKTEELTSIREAKKGGHLFLKNNMEGSTEVC